MLKKFGGWLRRHKKRIFISLVFIAILIFSTTYAYNQGQKAGKKAAMKRPDIASVFKNLPKKSSTQKSTTPVAVSTNSSGFFRLAGTVVKVDKSTLTIKLSNGSTINLKLKDGQTYLKGSEKIDVTKLPKNGTVFATGTIGTDGTFNVTIIQAK